MLMFFKIQTGSKIVAEDIERMLLQAEELLRSFEKNKIFITGGTGFFGTWLLHVLLAAEDKFELGLELYVFSRNPDSFLLKHPYFQNRKPLHFINGDVHTFEFPAVQVDSVIHAATEASASLNAEDPELMLETIIAGTKRTLDFAIHAKTKKFLVTSSGGVYSSRRQ